MKNILDYFNEAIKNLSKIYSLSEAESISRIWFEDVFIINHKDLLLNKNKPFIQPDLFHNQLKELMNEKPIQYITGFTYFLNNKFYVNDNVLIPRPETEELVVFANEICKKDNIKNVVEIGTGSGCISIALALLNNDLKVIATDISHKAIEVAQKNKENLNNKLNVNFIEHNILKDDWKYEIPDIVISNPPYILETESTEMKKNVLKYEPHQALFVTNNNPIQFYESIFNLFYKLGVKKFIFEINQNEMTSLKDFFFKTNFTVKFYKDMNKNYRIMTVL